jgi:hypothetical protein
LVPVVDGKTKMNGLDVRREILNMCRDALINTQGPLNDTQKELLAKALWTCYDFGMITYTEYNIKQWCDRFSDAGLNVLPVGKYIGIDRLPEGKTCEDCTSFTECKAALPDLSDKTRVCGWRTQHFVEKEPE